MSFYTLHTDYDMFFDYFEGKDDTGEFYSKREHYDHVFYMALDAEWHRVGQRNNILSYQIATVSNSRSENTIKYTNAGQRLKLIELIELGLRSVMPGGSLQFLDTKTICVFLVAHNLVAEWSALADREEDYITKTLDLIRKSPITKWHSRIKQTINQSIDVRICLFDTMLLAPVSHKSLKKLSALLGEKGKQKEDIKQHYIENMDQYLLDEPEKFERYALKDTEVTVQLFFLLQKELNEMVYDKIDLESRSFKLFRTLASAAVKGFLFKSKVPMSIKDAYDGHKSWYEYYLAFLKAEKFKKPYQLVKRCYHGGRSETYFVGRTNNFPETQNKVWIDIDLKGCYPTAMALCPLINISEEPEFYPLEYKLDRQTVKDIQELNVPKEVIYDLRKALKIKKKEKAELTEEECQVKVKERFEDVLFKLQGKNKDLSWDIRNKTRVINNSLIDKWYKHWNKLKEIGDNLVEHFLTPGFARVLFEFPKDTEFPCLPIRHERYGQIYVLKGETSATAIELMLAKDAGADIKAITSVEFPVQYEDDVPERFTLDHLSNLAQERDVNKKIMKSKDPKVTKDQKLQAEIRERLIKEFMNSFYGKFSQAINMKKVYNPSTGEQSVLGKSQLSEPITASLVTSLARAALSATLLAISDFNKGKSKQNQISVISATVDGMLIGVPAPKGYSVVEKYYKDEKRKSQEGEKTVSVFRKEYETQLPKILEEFGCGELIKTIEGHIPIKLMKYSRGKLTGNPDVFEIKHMADEIISIKTRGQIGLLSNDQAPLLARFNLKPPISEIIEDKEEYKRIMEMRGIEKDTIEARWILDYLERIENGDDKIEHYNFITLNTFQDIFKKDDKLDLVRKITPRQMNFDFDWKRKIVWEDDSIQKTSPFTEPFETISDMLQHRKMAESLRYKTVDGKRVAGNVARPAKVLEKVYVPTGSVHSRGGDPIVITRQFLRGMMQDKFPSNRKKQTYKAMADKVNDIWMSKDLDKSYPRVWKQHDFQNAKNPKQGKWQPGLIQSNILLEEIVEALAESFGADVNSTKEILFDFETFRADQILLIGEVISAIINGPKSHVEPFKKLFDSYRLPSSEKIRTTFKNILSDEQLDVFMNQPFIPGGKPSYDQPELKKIFYKLGLKKSEADKCARSIAPSSRKTGSFRNPGQKKCAEHFLLAVMNIVETDTDVPVKYLQQKLQKFGISRNRYYEIKRSGRFTPNSVADTSKNRIQIQKMAKSIGMEPSIFYEAMLEK